MCERTNTNGGLPKNSQFGALDPRALVPGYEKYIDAQQKMVSASIKLALDSMAVVHRELEYAGGLIKQMVAATTPEEFVACQRDLIEMMSSKYFQQLVKLTESAQALINNQSGPDAAEKPIAQNDTAKAA